MKKFDPGPLLILSLTFNCTVFCFEETPHNDPTSTLLSTFWVATMWVNVCNPPGPKQVRSLVPFQSTTIARTEMHIHCCYKVSPQIGNQQIGLDSATHPDWGACIIYVGCKTLFSNQVSCRCSQSSAFRQEVAHFIASKQLCWVIEGVVTYIFFNTDGQFSVWSYLSSCHFKFIMWVLALLRWWDHYGSGG